MLYLRLQQEDIVVKGYTSESTKRSLTSGQVWEGPARKELAVLRDGCPSGHIHV